MVMWMVKQESQENTKDSCKVQNLVPRESTDSDFIMCGEVRKQKLSQMFLENHFKLKCNRNV